MENQQEVLAFIQDQLAQWLQLAQNQPLYTAVVVSVAVLLIAIVYSFRIGFLKKDLSKLTKAKSEIQASLESAQKQNEALKSQIAELNKQLEQAGEATKAEARRANEADQRLNASNQQLAESLAKLVDCFELSVANIPTANAENLLTEYPSVIERVSERFQNEQQAKTQLQLSFHAETAKLAEKEMLISSLQHRLDSQTQQLAQMELAIEQYEAAQRQLEADREQQLAAAMAKQQADAAKVAELEKQQAKKQAATPSAPVEQKPKPVTPAEPPKEVNKPAVISKEEKPEQAVKLAGEEVSKTATSTAPVSETPKKTKPETKSSEGGKLKGFFGKAMDKITKLDEKLGTQTNVEAVPEPEEEKVEPQQPEPEPVQIAEIDAKPEEPKKDEKAPKSSEGVGAKMSSLFGGFKKAPAKQSEDIPPQQQPEVTPAIEKAESETLELEPAADNEATKPTKKLAGLFGKFKK